MRVLRPMDGSARRRRRRGRRRQRLETNESAITFNPRIMTQAYGRCFPNGCRLLLVLIAVLTGTSDDSAYGVTTAMSVLIYRRFGGSAAISLHLSRPSRLPVSVSLFLALAPLSVALIIPIRSNSPFPPLFWRGREPEEWEEAKERLSRPR